MEPAEDVSDFTEALLVCTSSRVARSLSPVPHGITLTRYGLPVLAARRFTFDTPSPDDIVRQSQTSVFERKEAN